MRLFGRRKAAQNSSLPVLQTERLVLRSFDLNDAIDVFAYARDPSVGQMAGWEPHQSAEDSRAQIERMLQKGDTWAIVDKKSGHVIGTFSLHKDERRQVEGAMEMGYALGQSYWGQGFATEACKEVMSYAFQTLNCSILAAALFPQNTKARHVMKKLGFYFDGTLRSAFAMPDGTLADQLLFSLTSQEYKAQCEKANGGKA